MLDIGSYLTGTMNNSKYFMISLLCGHFQLNTWSFSVRFHKFKGSISFARLCNQPDWWLFHILNILGPSCLLSYLTVTMRPSDLSTLSQILFWHNWENNSRRNICWRAVLPVPPAWDQLRMRRTWTNELNSQSQSSYTSVGSRELFLWTLPVTVTNHVFIIFR